MVQANDRNDDGINVDANSGRSRDESAAVGGCWRDIDPLGAE